MRERGADDFHGESVFLGISRLLNGLLNISTYRGY